MDVSVYIFGAALALFLAAVVFLVTSIVRFARDRRHNVRLAERVGAVTPEVAISHRRPSPAITDGAPTQFGAPLRTGTWQPESRPTDSPILLAPVAEIVASLDAEDQADGVQHQATEVSTARPAEPYSVSASAAAQPPPPFVAATPAPRPSAPPASATSGPVAATLSGADAAIAADAPTSAPPVPSTTDGQPAADTSGAQVPGRTTVTTRPATPPPTTSPVSESAAESAEYSLVAPVELWFGDARVGVKPGSRAHGEFLRLANALLSDVRRSRDAGQP